MATSEAAPVALTADEMDNMLNDAFQKLEIDRGYISSGSLAELCASLNTPITDEEHERVAGSLDKDGNGRIELFEFKNWWLGKVVFGDGGEEQQQRNGRGAGSGSSKHPGMSAKASGLLEAKLARKQAEADAQLLTNRIALLRQEEAKAWKKIQQTKIRAADILKLREDAERRQLTKAEFMMQENEHKRRSQHSRFLQKQQDRSMRQKAQAAVVRKRQDDVREVRRMTREMEVERLRQRQSEQERARYNREVVRTHEMRLKAAKRKKEVDRLRNNELHYEQRVREEHEKTREKEAFVAQMEREEIELIQRLQRAQLGQKGAYEQLEGALSGTLQM
jgi:hypothetical protein